MVIALSTFGNWITQIGATNANFSWVEFLIFFLLILIETGGVVTGFIPGDALVMTAGGLAGRHHSLPELALLILLFALASLLGDAINYWFGAFIVRLAEKIPLIHRHLNGDFANQIAENFNTRRWLLLIILGRFLPLIRTVVPLMAHRLRLPFSHYVRFSALSSLLWAATIATTGYYFGHLELPREVTIAVLIFALAFAIMVLRSAAFRQRLLRLVTNPAAIEQEENK
ncbi:VTT domain-containing protein [Leuconostocaceae bacterium ESL0958]|nr:VTT domain-containing protein [Leuconostocaceae bacterium ESL0958]